MRDDGNQPKGYVTMRAKQVLKYWLPAIGASAILPIAAASAAHGSVHQYKVTATTHLSARADSGGNGTWALDNFTRVATVTSQGSVPPVNCGSSYTGPCYAYTASLKDSGRFMTINGAFAPNQGAPYTGMLIASRVKGQFKGYGTFTTFFATAKPKAQLVPKYVAGNPAGDESSNWPTLFFPSGTTLVCVNEATFGYLYTAHVRHHRHAGKQHWADTSANGAGQLPADGNITG